MCSEAQGSMLLHTAGQATRAAECTDLHYGPFWANQKNTRSCILGSDIRLLS